MNKPSATAVFAPLLLAALSLSALLIGGCGGREVGSLDQIIVVTQRYVMDEGDDVVRVVGQVRNAGDLPTPPADIVATLRNRAGTPKGQNRVSLPRLDAGAEEQFALAITSRSDGAIDEVEINIVEPGAALNQAVTPENADEETPAETGDEETGSESDGS